MRPSTKPHRGTRPLGGTSRFVLIHKFDVPFRAASWHWHQSFSPARSGSRESPPPPFSLPRNGPLAPFRRSAASLTRLASSSSLTPHRRTVRPRGVRRACDYKTRRRPSPAAISGTKSSIDRTVDRAPTDGVAAPCALAAATVEPYYLMEHRPAIEWLRLALPPRPVTPWLLMRSESFQHLTYHTPGNVRSRVSKMDLKWT